MKILVTGGAGFIGSNFVRYIYRERPEWTITVLDALTYAGNPENLKDVEHLPNYRFVKGDINDEAFINDVARVMEYSAAYAAYSEDIEYAD